MVLAVFERADRVDEALAHQHGADDPPEQQTAQQRQGAVADGVIPVDAHLVEADQADRQAHTDDQREAGQKLDDAHGLGLELAARGPVGEQ